MTQSVLCSRLWDDGFVWKRLLWSLVIGEPFVDLRGRNLTFEPDRTAPFCPLFKKLASTAAEHHVQFWSFYQIPTIIVVVYDASAYVFLKLFTDYI